MSALPVITFKNVWKSYPSYYRITGGVKSFLFHLPQALRDLKERRTALEDISFDIYRGENFGFVGRNGAGKSTMLGLIAKVLYPDKGEIIIRDRVSPLLELGAGFHPELSGRENIMLNGILLGLTRQEVQEQLEEIIDFSELGEFIEQPVRVYSSGMFAKLGFSLVSTLKPEIILLDEILAVGDIAFQKKCEKTFEAFSANPNLTVVLVSHGLDSVERYCHRAAWVENKQIRLVGPAADVVKEYRNALLPKVTVPSMMPPFPYAVTDNTREGGTPTDGTDNKRQRTSRGNERLNIVFNTYPEAFDVVGGGEVQLLAYQRHLPLLGLAAKLYDQWNPCLDLCDIMHFFSVMPGALPFCSYVRSQDIPLFISPNMWLDDVLASKVPVCQIREQLQLATRIICNSNVESENFSRILDLPLENFLTIYTGIDEVFTTSPGPELFKNQAGEIGKFILNVGTVESRKNQLTLIRVMKQFPDYKLVLIGNVRDQRYAKQCFEEGGEQVVYQGPILHKDSMLRSAMNACDLFVGPGLIETPGGASLEAAAQGARLAITSVGSAHEYFGDHAVYFDPVDERDMAQAIATALERPHNLLLQNHIRENFTWKTVLQPLVDAYKMVVWQ